MDDKIKYTIELVDGSGNAIKGVIKSSEDLKQKVRGIKSPLNDVNKSFDGLNKQLGRYKKLRDESFRTDHIKKYNLLIRETEGRIKDLEKQTGTCGMKTDQLFGKFKQFTGIAAIIGGIAAVKKFGSESLDAAAQVETYMVTLKNLLGGELDAMKRMNDYSRIAAKTPFELSEVVEAGNKLQTLGRYSEETLTMLGDLAAASGKPFEQVMNAYANLATGQKGEAARMFRDLSIAENDWIAATGKGVTKNGELLATTQEMEKALSTIMKQKGFTGLMAQQAETTKGKISNLNDAMFQLKTAIGERMQPAQKSFITGLTEMINKMKGWYEIPIEDKLQDEITKIKVLHDELTDSNTSEERRITIINELNKISPELTEDVEAQAINYQTLSENVNKVVKGLQEKIFWERADKKYKKELTEYENYESEKQEAEKKVRELYIKYEIQGNTFAEKTKSLQKKLAAEAAGDIKVRGGKNAGLVDTRNQQAKDLQQLMAYGNIIKTSGENAIAQQELMKKIQQENEQLAKDLGFSTTPSEGNEGKKNEGKKSFPGGGDGKIAGDETTSFDSVISGGGGNVKQINISLEALIKNNTNVVNNVNSDLEDFGGKLKATLLTMLNDINQSAN